MATAAAPVATESVAAPVSYMTAYTIRMLHNDLPDVGADSWDSLSTDNGEPRTSSSTTTTRDCISSATRFFATASALTPAPRFQPSPDAIIFTVRSPARGRTAPR